MKADVFPGKAFFPPAETPYFYYEGNEEEIFYSVYRLEKKVFSKRARLQTRAGKKILVLPSLQKGSYGLEIEKGPQTAFEILDSPTEDPHYGFIANFTPGQEVDDSIFFLKFHLNIAQHYDWMYRHEDYLAPSNPFVDPMGKTKSQEIVKEKIKKGHSINVFSYAYGPLYGATNEFAATKKDWVFFNGLGQPIHFINRFTIMNFATSPWQERLLQNYKKAITAFNFDGIHIDTYGEPKAAFSKEGRLIDFSKFFGPVITKASEQLAPFGATVTFNNVGGWPLLSTVNRGTAFDYAEIWDPLSDYNDLLTLVRYHHALSKAPFVVAAYLKPYYGQEEAAVNANIILSSLLYASGAHHFVYGEEGRVLRTGYYSDNHLLSDNAIEELRKIEDLSCRYAEVLFDSRLNDVSLTHAFGDNREYVFKNANVTAKPKENSILSILREREGLKLISLLNFYGLSSTIWNEGKSTPKLIEGPVIDVLIESKDYHVYAASPSSPRLREIAFQQKEENDGVHLIFAAGTISFWKLFILKKE